MTVRRKSGSEAPGGGPRTGESHRARVVEGRGRSALGASAILAAVVLSLPLAAATPTTVAPPYASATGILFNSLYWTGCSGSGGKTTVAANANHSSGNVALGGKLWGVGCNATRTYGSWDAGGGFAGPTFSVANGGRHQLTMHWTLDYSAKVSLSVPNASVAASVGIYVYVVGFIVDLTNGTHFVGPKYLAYGSQNVTSDRNASFRIHHEAQHLILTTNATLNRTHTFEFYTLVSVGLSFDVGPGARASASLNMGNHGERATLSFVTIY